MDTKFIVVSLLIIWQKKLSTTMAKASKRKRKQNSDKPLLHYLPHVGNQEKLRLKNLPWKW
jgi:hypothetical protein